MWFKTLVDRSNDPDGEFHLDRSSAFFLGRYVNVALDIVHINIISLWFLTFYAIL
jgi:hypothetical protein